MAHCVGYSMLPFRFSWRSHCCTGGSSATVEKSRSSRLVYARISAGAAPSDPPMMVMACTAEVTMSTFDRLASHMAFTDSDTCW